MGKIIVQGECRYCHQMINLKVDENRHFEPHELNAMASEACTCEGAQYAQRKKEDISRVESFIAKYITPVIPSATQTLEMLMQQVADQDVNKAVVAKDGYKITVAPTKERIVDIKVAWNIASTPSVPEYLVPTGEDTEGV